MSGRSEGGVGQETEPARDAGRSAAEWTTLAISLAIVLGLVGLLVADEVTRGSAPPIIEVSPQLDAVRSAGGAYYLPIAVVNRGDLPAQDVQVQVFLADGQGAKEFASFRIDFLAGGESRDVVVAFGQDPARATLTNVVGFREP
jgi:uncharacterized protein (TIGR02588 family)